LGKIIVLPNFVYFPMADSASPPTDLANRYDVAIIGGGITGCAIARELSRYACRTILLERDIEVGFGTSKANSGIIHGGHHSDPSTLKGQLEWEGNQYWDQLHDELGFGFSRVGELTVAMDEEQLATLDKLEHYGAAKGVPGLERWDRDRIRQEEPNLNPDAIAAVYAPTTGVVNPYEACFLLLESACRNGVVFQGESPVTGLMRESDHWIVTTPQGQLAARFVINAAGLYADEIADLAGVRTFTIRARKGEEYLLDKRLNGYVSRVIFPCPTPVSKGILVIPTYDGTLMVGPTAQFVEHKEDDATTATGAQEVFESVTRLVPGISARDCIAEFAGLRAVADTEDFVIGPSSQPGFINVAGIQSPGLTAAPAIAHRLVDLLQEEGVTLSLRDDFQPAIEHPIHFMCLTTEEQMALAERDPSFARIICRCELVTEGEIREALDRGARCLDGLKFRTRAGMGRCQGGFCSSRCMELIADKYDIPLTAVTKRGGNSWVARERVDGAPVEGGNRE
jgi:glycerol-3-phosphate dehydrogenase